MPVLSEAFFLDCGVTYNGDPATTIGNLDHLEGEVVKIIADGKVHPDRTVTGGVVLLDYAASVVHVGFGYTAKMKSLPIDAALQDGNSQGRLKLIPEAILIVNESVGLKAGPDVDNLDTFMLVEDETFATATDFYSGAIDVNIESGHNRQARVVIQHEEGTPLTVNAMNLAYEVTQQ